MWLSEYMRASSRLLHISMLIFVWKVLCNTKMSTCLQERACYTLYSNSVWYTFVCVTYPAVNYSLNCIIPISFLDLVCLFHELKKPFINVFRYIQKNPWTHAFNLPVKNNHYILTFELGESFELKAELHCSKCHLYWSQQFPQKSGNSLGRQNCFPSSIDITNIRIMMLTRPRSIV